MSSLLAWTRPARLSANGASDLLSRGFPASRRSLGAGDPPTFPPGGVVQVKALACELPYRLQLPLSRLSLSEIRREVICREQGHKKSTLTSKLIRDFLTSGGDDTEGNRSKTEAKKPLLK